MNDSVDGDYRCLFTGFVWHYSVDDPQKFTTLGQLAADGKAPTLNTQAPQTPVADEATTDEQRRNRAPTTPTDGEAATAEGPQQQT